MLEQKEKRLVPNVRIFLKLPPNRGHLSIAEKFSRPVDVRYSEVSLYLKEYRWVNNYFYPFYHSFYKLEQFLITSVHQEILLFLGNY